MNLRSFCISNKNGNMGLFVVFSSKEKFNMSFVFFSPPSPQSIIFRFSSLPAPPFFFSPPRNMIFIFQQEIKIKSFFALCTLSLSNIYNRIVLTSYFQYDLYCVSVNLLFLYVSKTQRLP